MEQIEVTLSLLENPHQFNILDYIKSQFKNRTPDIDYLTNEKRKKKNIIIYFITISLISFQFSFLFGSFYTAFLSSIFKSNEAIGLTFTIAEITSLIVALPIGFVIDKYNRSLICYIGSLVLLSSFVLASSSIIMELRYGFYIFPIFLFIGLDLTMGAAHSLFADSLQKNKILSYSTLLSILSSTCRAASPLLSWIFLIFTGQTVWSKKLLKIFLNIGACFFGPLSIVTLLNFHNVNPKQKDDTFPISSVMKDLSTPLDIKNDNFDENTSPFIELELEQHSNELETEPLTPYWLNWLFKNGRVVPMILFLHESFYNFASGFNSFVSLYLIKDYDFTPITMSAFNFACLLAVALVLITSKYLHIFLNEPVLILIASLFDFFFTLILGLVTNRPLVLIFCLLQTCLPSIASPCINSLHIEYIPSNQRGKWDAVSNLTFIFSALANYLGGRSADAHGYRFNFLIAGLGHAFTTLTSICLIFSIKYIKKHKISTQK